MAPIHPIAHVKPACLSVLDHSFHPHTHTLKREGERERERERRRVKAALVETLQKNKLLSRMPFNKDNLPVSRLDEKDTARLIGNGDLRNRLSSFSVKIQPSLYSASAREWTFRRSKSMSSVGAMAGGSLRRWWDRGWGWLLSRKPTIARDLEINEEETTKLGRHSKGTWRRIFYKVQAEIRKLMHSNATLPTTKGFGYSSFDYRHNFDDGNSSPEHIVID